MKKFIAAALVTLGITVSARPQWIVYDPANTVQSVSNTAQEIAKSIEMINNQVQQIQTLTDQLNEFKHDREPVRRSQGGRAHHGPTARDRPAQDGTRPDAHRSRRRGGRLEKTVVTSATSFSFKCVTG